MVLYWYRHKPSFIEKHCKEKAVGRAVKDFGENTHNLVPIDKFVVDKFDDYFRDCLGDYGYEFQLEIPDDTNIDMTS